MIYGKSSLLKTTAVVVVAIGLALSPSYGQRGGMGGSGGGGDHGSGADTGHESEKGGKAGRGGGMGRGGSSGQSLRDVFRDMESGSEHSEPGEKGSGKHGSSTTTERGHKASGSEHSESGEKGSGSSRGKKGSTTTTERGHKDSEASKSATSSGHGSSSAKKGKTTPNAAEEEDSDRPAWAGTPGRDGKPGRGNTASGTKRGDIFGDMYVLLRDANGVPILNANGFVQPVDASGNVIPQDAEGNLLNPELAIPVELARLNVGRSPLTVLASQYEEALKSINAADSISLDAAGRIVLTTGTVTKTIDSPLANLALYKEIMTTGTITGLTEAAKAKIDATGTANLIAIADGTASTADLPAAASFLGAASDKTVKVTVDTVVYMNTILGINTKTETGTISYFDFTSFSFNPQTAYSSSTVNVLVKQTVPINGTPTTVYVPSTVNVYDTLFKTQTSSTSVAAFTQAVDDTRAIIQYVHDNSIAAE